MYLLTGYYRRNYAKLISETSDGRYRCERCCKSIFKYKHHLYRHLREECHVDPLHLCMFCNYQAKRKETLKAHIIGVHKTLMVL